MADRRRELSLRQLHSASAHSAAQLTHSEQQEVTQVTAAAQVLYGAEYGHLYRHQYQGWQEEAWDFYLSLGEFNYGVEWFSEALSRIRLMAAYVSGNGDEPTLIDSGPAADIVANLVGGTDGQSQLLRSLGVQLSVPGDAYFVGREVTAVDFESGALLDAEPDEHGRIWTVQPNNTLRRSRRRVTNMFKRSVPGWEIQVADDHWVTLPQESLVCRIWDRNEYMPWRANSPARAALPIMREIDMYNRYIVATLISRVALNGMLLIPDEVTLPSNPAYENSSDPFVSELIDIMRSAIKNPGSPASAAPLPLRIPAEYIDSFKHLTFATPLDQKIFEHRAQALRRLATTLNLPAEIVTGLGDTNHWSAWSLTEDAIKIHISPKIEIITRALTIGYLHPVLRALNKPLRGPNGERIVVWYDTSELTQRPDRSGVALDLYRLKAINGAALRRETGFDESDMPTNDELERMILTDLAVNPQMASAAMKELTGLELEVASPAGPQAPGAEMGDGAPEPQTDTTNQSTNTGPPDTRDEPPPPPDDDVTAAAVNNGVVTQSVHDTLDKVRLRVSTKGPHRG